MLCNLLAFRPRHDVICEAIYSMAMYCKKKAMEVGSNAIYVIDITTFLMAYASLSIVEDPCSPEIFQLNRIQNLPLLKK